MAKPVDQSRIDAVADEYGVRVAQAFGKALEAEGQRELATTAKKLIDPLSARMADAADQSKGISTLASAATSLTKGASGAGQALSSMSQYVGALGPEAMVAGAAIGALGALSGTIQQLVAVSNPALMERFNNAWDDLMGTIGNALEPIVAGMADGLRFLADVVASNIDGVKSFISAMVDFARTFGELVVNVSKWLAALPGGMGYLIAPGLALAGAAINNTKAGASAGMAAGKTSFASLEGLGENARLSAYRMGGGRSAKDVAEDQLTVLKRIAEKQGVPPDPNQARVAVRDGGAGGDF